MHMHVAMWMLGIFLWRPNLLALATALNLEKRVD